MMITIIMPTKDRPDKVINALNIYKNIISDDWEIIVIDDGSEQTLQLPDIHELKLLKQNPSGPAAARNMGIKAAKGDIVFITGDDIVPDKNLISEHLITHKQNPGKSIAVLGYTTWAKNIRHTPFMKWLENGGPQFKYWDITDQQDVYYGHLYTSNISFKRDFLIDNGFFDERFHSAAWEDIELGLRLKDKGLRIIYNKNAIAFHDHPTSISKYLERMKLAGISEGIFAEITGAGCTVKPFKPKLISRVKYNILKTIAVGLQYFILSPQLYAYLCDYQRRMGINEYLSTHSPAGS